METIFNTATVGDLIEVTCEGKSRTVTVTERIGKYVYTTSGKVRPGHIAGGAIKNDDGVITFQATMQQDVKRVENLRNLSQPEPAKAPVLRNPLPKIAYVLASKAVN